eukprot:157414-Amphidinium_carterae.1
MLVHAFVVTVSESKMRTWPSHKGGDIVLLLLPPHPGAPLRNMLLLVSHSAIQADQRRCFPLCQSDWRKGLRKRLATDRVVIQVVQQILSVTKISSKSLK